MTEIEARSKALEQLAAKGYAMNWPGRLVVTASPPYGDGTWFAIMDDRGPGDFLRDLGEGWPVQEWTKVFLQPQLVRWRWTNPRARRGYSESTLFVYSLTDDDYQAFLKFCNEAGA